MKKMLFAGIAILVAMSATTAIAGDDTSLKIGANVYFDYFMDMNDYEDDDQTAVRGFQMRRAYLTVKKKMGDFGFRYTSDIDYKYGTGNLNAYSKYAYLEHGGLLPNAKLIVGLHSPKTHGWVEKHWHYRSMAKTMADMNKWTNAAELGIGVQGKISEGKVEYYLDLNNGNGYKKPLAKDGMGFAARVAAQPVDGFHVSGMFSSNTVGTYDDDGSVAGSDEADTYFEGLAGFENDRFGLFGQYGMFTDGPSEVASSGMSFFGRLALVDGLYAMGRFDMVDPDTDTDSDGTNFMLVGLDYALAKGFYVQPSFRVVSYEADGMDAENEFVITFYGKI